MKMALTLATTVLITLNQPVLAGENVPAKTLSPAPDIENFKYGPHERNVLDLWKAKSDRPTPLVIFIHGGGFFAGDKKLIYSDLPFTQFLAAGVSCASIQYRYSTQAIYPAPFLDCARAVQVLRSKAREWNLDPAKFDASGRSAGAGISLWLGFHDDLADSKSDDPVARESTRLTCMTVHRAQCSYDPRFIKQNIPGNGYKENALVLLFGLKPNQTENFSPDKIKLLEDSAPINHVSAGDPPVFMRYDTSISDPTGDIHHAKFGELLKARLDSLNIECVLLAKDFKSKEEREVDFVLRQFGMKK